MLNNKLFINFYARKDSIFILCKLLLNKINARENDYYFHSVFLLISISHYYYLLVTIIIIIVLYTG